MHILSDHLRFEETRKREQLVLTGMAYPCVLLDLKEK